MIKSLLASHQGGPYDFISVESTYFQFILEHDYINTIVDRIPYSNPDTAEKLKIIKEIAIKLCEDKVIGKL